MLSAEPFSRANFIIDWAILDFIVSLTPSLVRETVLVVAAAVRELQNTIKFWLFLKETNLHKSINDPDPITIIFSYSFD